MAGFGTPKHGGNYKPSPKPLPKEGSLTFRVLPPILSCVDTGEWARPYAQHFGYQTPDPQDPSKTKYNTFLCIERSKWEDSQRIVLQSCPEDVLIETRKKEWERTKARLEEQGKSEEEVRATTKHLVDWLKRHSRDFKWYVNVKDSAGEFYTLKLPSKCKKAIDGFIKQYREAKRPIDPIDATQGLWFKVTRTGKGLQTEYATEVVMEEEEFNGRFLKTEKLAPLTEADAEKAEQQCWDLTNVGIRKLSPEKVQMLVDSCGDVPQVEAIFKSSDRRESSPAPTAAPARSEPRPSAPVQQQKPVSAPAVQKPAPAPAPEPAPAAEDDEVAAALAALEAAKKKRAEKAAAAAAAETARAAAASAPAPTSADSGPSDPDDDEAAFLEQFRT